MKPQTVAILGGIAAITVLYIANEVRKGGATMLRTIGDQVDPTNPDNVFASGINKVGGILVTEPTGNGKNADGSWTLGGWLYDVTHPEEVAAIKDISSPTGGGRNTQITPIEVYDPYSDPHGYYYP